MMKHAWREAVRNRHRNLRFSPWADEALRRTMRKLQKRLPAAEDGFTTVRKTNFDPS
jgi:hypothetical protein